MTYALVAAGPVELVTVAIDRHNADREVEATAGRASEVHELSMLVETRDQIVAYSRS